MSEERPLVAPPPSHLLDADAEIHEQIVQADEEAISPEILPAWRPARTVLHWLSLVEEAVAVVLLVALLLLVLDQVAGRYTPWVRMTASGEWARLCMVWMTFILSGYLMARDGHITIRAIDYVLPVRARGAIQLFGHLFVALACSAASYAIVDLILRDRGQVTGEAEVPLTFIYAIGLFGFVSTALRAFTAMLVLDVAELKGIKGPAR